MLGGIFRFELRYQLRSPVVWVIAFAFAFLAFVATTTDVISVGEGMGSAHRNAPFVILNLLGMFSLFGMFVAIAMTAQPLLRDFELGTDELFFSTPLRKSAYLWGRFFAGLVVGVLALLVAALAMMLGSFMPWLDPQQIGPFSPAPYLFGFGIILLPNLIFIAAFMTLLAVTTRRLLMVFLGAIAFLVLWQIAGALTKDIQHDTITALIDPFGLRPLTQTMRYWSVTERNTLVPAISGLLLMNRVLWMSVAAVMLIAAQVLFKPERLRSKKRWWHKRAAQKSEPIAAPAASTVAVRVKERRFERGTAFRQFLHLIVFDARAVLKGLPFLILLAFALINFIGGLEGLETTYGTPIYPMTSMLMQSMQGTYQFLLALIIAFYAGEILWRDRDAKLAEVSDSLPVPNWVPALAKIGTLFAIVFCFMAIGGLAGMMFQLFKGYTNFEIGVYLQTLLVDSVPFLMGAVLAVFLQVMSNHKFVGYMLLIVMLIVQITLGTAGFEHNLYSYAGSPQMMYSDMNGYGHLLKPWAWFNVYWSLFAVMLVILSVAFWVRGTSSSWKLRWQHAMQSLRGPQGAMLGSLAVAFIAVGVWIFYNTNVLNEYRPKPVTLDRQAYFEKEYRQFKGLPQPTLLAVRADVQLFPEQRRVAIYGHYRIINKHDVAIPELHVYTDVDAEIQVKNPNDVTYRVDDKKAGVKIVTLREPLAPHAEMDFDFIVTRAERGFTNNGMPPAKGAGDLRSVLNYNGTFFNSMEVMPRFGYNEANQILDRNERRKRGLGDVPRMAKLEDEAARMSNGLGDADWIDFEATVSTSADQIAMAPGYLQREWTQNGRRYFHYKMDRPMLPFYCFLSARWEVAKGEWHGVPIEIYHDAKHPYNTQRMIDATRKSLDYYTANFSPYQHHQVRILEFPRYAQFAQSFANTIPYSEGLGFIADLRDPENIDYVFYVTAHEMAHQWWGHQVLGADVQGGTMIMESLSQYSALMVMEKEYGREHMRRFLKYELDRYLRGRGGEILEELPLMRVENQGYIHYRKGSLVFYRLREEIGEQNLNRALAAYIKDKAWQQPPYTTTKELLEYIKAETPPDKYTLLDELFAKIVFYDNRVTATSATRRADGKYDVTIEYQAAKRESDGVGKESDLKLDDWIEVGVFARGESKKESSEKQLYLQRERITQQAGTFRVTVDEQPYEVGFDPFNKLIDRIPDDNRKTVTLSDPT